jgi:hypothetical protein
MSRVFIPTRIDLITSFLSSGILVAFDQYPALRVVQVRPILLEIIIEVYTVEHGNNPLLAVVTCDKDRAEVMWGRRDVEIGKLHCHIL